MTVRGATARRAATEAGDLTAMTAGPARTAAARVLIFADRPGRATAGRRPAETALDRRRASAVKPDPTDRVLTDRGVMIAEAVRPSAAVSAATSAIPAISATCLSRSWAGR